ncbi:hypothetical protein [Streptomyces rubiginosohelvolus]|uniref:hypothetical protein n=1 Tax=Streptomyces rubiginosohelvolus TaxID=67362 RepID=UPI00367E577F
MATYTTETLTSTIRRWIVLAAEPWGATAEEIGKAWAGAELRPLGEQHVPDNQPQPRANRATRRAARKKNR